jgi:hypothetical protein
MNNQPYSTKRYGTLWEYDTLYFSVESIFLETVAMAEYTGRTRNH